MKEFHFDLEMLLKVKKDKEKCIQMHFSKAHSEHVYLMKQKEVLDEEIRQYENSLRHLVHQNNLESYLPHCHYLEQLLDKKNHIQQDIDLHKKLLRQHQEKMAIAMRERKVLEKLKEKAYFLWEAKLKKQEI